MSSWQQAELPSCPLLRRLPGCPRAGHPHRSRAGSRVLVIGGGLVGSETAEFLADKGREVTVVELRDGIALDMEYKTRQMLMPKLAALGVVFLTETEVLEIGCNGNVKVKTPIWKKNSPVLTRWSSRWLSPGRRPLRGSRRRGH
ncbi:MAG: FAD-dependent oxidoreductase [Bilophila wadsworthia]